MNMAGDGMSRSPVCRTGWHLHVVCGEQQILDLANVSRWIKIITLLIYCGEAYE